MRLSISIIKSKDNFGLNTRYRQAIDRVQIGVCSSATAKLVESGTLGMKFALDRVPLMHRIADRTREKEMWQRSQPMVTGYGSFLFSASCVANLQ